MYMSSPVRSGDALFALSQRHGGQYVCIDLATGRTLWAGPVREGDQGGIVRVAGDLLLLTTEGTLTVVRADQRRRIVVRRYEIADSPTWALPVPTPAGLLIRDEEHLTLWAAKQ